MKARGLKWMGVLLCFLTVALAVGSAMQGLWLVTAFDCFLFLIGAATVIMNSREQARGE